MNLIYSLLVIIMQFTRFRLAHSLLTPTRGFLKGQGCKIGRFPTKHFSSVSTVAPVIEKLYQTIRPPSHPTDIILKQDDNETIRSVGEALQAYFISGQRLPFELVSEILRDSTTNFKQLPNILPLKIPTSSSSIAVAPAISASSEIPRPNGGKLNVCGDTHGQFYDFCEIFDNEVGGYPSLTNHYLFNGDIVDRGPMALEIFLYLLTIKLISSKTIHILRGNHESIGMTNVFGFKNEIKKKYFQHSNLLMNTFYDLFHSLPIGAVIEEKVFVTHGGLGPSTFQLKIDEINQLNRFNEPDDTGVIGEFLWGGKTVFLICFSIVLSVFACLNRSDRACTFICS